MAGNRSHEFREDLFQQMTDREFLKKAGIRKKQMMDIYKKNDWNL